MHRVELFFSHDSKNGDTIPARRVKEVEKWVLGQFSELFQGGVLEHHVGGYRSANGRIMLEPCTIIWSYTKEVDKNIQWLRRVASRVAHELQQESVLLSTSKVANGLMEWVTSYNPD